MNINSASEIRFESRRPWPVASVLWIFAAVLMVALGLFGTEGEEAVRRGLLLAAALPVAFAVSTWIARPRRVEGILTNDAIVLTTPELTIPLSQVLAVTSPERDRRKNDRKRFSINVHHETGLLHIPKKLDINGDELYLALIERLPQVSRGWSNPLLQDYLHRQTDTFGPERVHVFNALIGRRKEGNTGRALRIYAASLLVLGLLWAVAGEMIGNPDTQRTAFLTMGVTLSFVSTILFASSYSARVPIGIKKWHESSLIVTPVGLALVQGDVKGELTWNQLLDLKLKPKGVGSFQLTHGSDPGLGILLKVEGVTISIVDIYDRPLSLIYGKMVRYWRPQYGHQTFEPIDL